MPPQNAPLSLLMSADSATLKLDNQKNGWKEVCNHQEANGEASNCPVRALARHVSHLRDNGAEGKVRPFSLRSFTMAIVLMCAARTLALARG